MFFERRRGLGVGRVGGGVAGLALGCVFAGAGAADGVGGELAASQTAHHQGARGARRDSLLGWGSAGHDGKGDAACEGEQHGQQLGSRGWGRMENANSEPQEEEAAEGVPRTKLPTVNGMDRRGGTISGSPRS